MDILTWLLAYVFIAGLTVLYEDRRRAEGEPGWACVAMGVLWPVHWVVYPVFLVRALAEARREDDDDGGW